MARFRNFISKGVNSAFLISGTCRLMIILTVICFPLLVYVVKKYLLVAKFCVDTLRNAMHMIADGGRIDRMFDWQHLLNRCTDSQIDGIFP